MINYINHINKTVELFQIDDRLTSNHLAVYLCLFKEWNRARFKNPIQISRRELMPVSKIKSNSTYSKILTDLTKWGYIEYLPHKNPMLGSKVFLVDLCTSESTITGSSDVQDSVQVSVHPLYINNTNIKTKEKRNITPTLIEIQDYFISKGEYASEAIKFYNHYESNGWLIGGKSPMKNWRASVDSWVLKINSFNTKKFNPNNLTIQPDKNYNEKL